MNNYKDKTKNIKVILFTDEFHFKRDFKLIQSNIKFTFSGDIWPDIIRQKEYNILLFNLSGFNDINIKIFLKEIIKILQCNPDKIAISYDIVTNENLSDLLFESKIKLKNILIVKNIYEAIKKIHTLGGLNEKSISSC